MDKTLKLRAFSGAPQRDVPQAKPVEEKGASPELAKVSAQLEEERSKTLELLKNVVQLRESLKQEQEKTAEAVKKAATLEAKANELATLDANQLARKNAQLEEEKQKSLELAKTIEQLRERIKQDQAKMADVSNISARLDAKTKEAAMLEEQVKELTAVLNKIAGIAAARKLDSKA